MNRRPKFSMAWLMFGLCVGWCLPVGASDEDGRQLWDRLRQIQSVRATKLGCGYEMTSSDAESGDQVFLRLRRPVSLRMVLYAGMDVNNFKSSAPVADASQRQVISSGLAYNRRSEELFAGCEMDQQGHPGVEMEWLKPVQAGTLFMVTGRRRLDRDGFLSVRHGEVTDELKTALFWDPPSPFFMSQELRVYQSTLLAADQARGHGEQWVMQGGLHFERRPDRRVGWEFRSADLRNENSIGEYVEFNVVQSVDIFSAGQNYLNRIAKPGRTTPLSVGAVLSHPLSPKLAMRLQVSSGQDASRDLAFFKILNTQALLALVPNHRQQILLNFEHSTENTGVVSGDISRVSFSFQWNL